MLVLAADHVIADEDALSRAAVRNAMPYAEAGERCDLGIVPDLPETGYGYIRERCEVSAGQQDTVAC